MCSYFPLWVTIISRGYNSFPIFIWFEETRHCIILCIQKISLEYSFNFYKWKDIVVTFKKYFVVKSMFCSIWVIMAKRPFWVNWQLTQNTALKRSVLSPLTVWTNLQSWQDSRRFQFAFSSQFYVVDLVKRKQLVVLICE